MVVHLKASIIWFYQRILMLCLSVLFATYCILLGIPCHIIALFLLLTIPCVFSPRKVCYSIPVPLLNGLRVNYCGFLLPLKAAIVILAYGSVNALNVLLLTSISILFASIHTHIAKEMVLVNVARYLISFTAMSFAILHLSELLYALPFAVVIGLATGSDLMSYILINAKDKRFKGSMVVGGFMALDAIALSFLFTLVVLTFVKVLILVGVIVI